MYQYKANIVIIGDHNVGKSTLMQAYVGSRRPKQDLDCQSKIVHHKIKAVIWETDKSSFQDVIDYLKSIQGILLVFDLTDRLTFVTLDRWLKKCPKCPIVLVGNKCDLERAISTEEATAWARQHELPYVETGTADHAFAKLLDLIDAEHSKRFKSLIS